MMADNIFSRRSDAAWDESGADGAPTFSESCLIDKIPHLRRYARALVGERDRADDLVQDCLVQAIRRRHLFRPGTDLRAWLFRILHNLHVSQTRRPKLILVEPSGFDDQLSAPASQDGRVLLKDLRRGLALLPREQRATLLLIVLEGMRYEDVARVTGVAVGTVRTRLFRARETLRRFLASDRGRRVETRAAAGRAA
jgi:RNA polymerase sigma-70 factor, ECF subfamily